MRTSTSSSRSTTPPRQSGHDQEELDRHTFMTSAIKSSFASPVPSLQGQSAPTMVPSVTPSTRVHGSPVQFADGDNTTCGADLGLVKRAAISGGPGAAEAGVKKVLLSAHTEGAIGASRKSVDNVGDDVPLIKAHSDENEALLYTSATGIGADATQSIVAEREKTRVPRWQGRSPDCSTRHPRIRIKGIHTTQVWKQIRWICRWTFQLPWIRMMTRQILSLASCQTPPSTYQPHLYGHGLDIKRDRPIIKGIRSGLVANSVMEDATPESRMVDVPVAASTTLQPFSWVPPSTSGAFHAIFPTMLRLMWRMNCILCS